MAHFMSRTASRAKKAPPGLAEQERPFAHDDIMRGVEAKKVKALIDRGVLVAKQVYRFVPERTFKRRIAQKATLKPSEADGVNRLLRLTEMATEVFGDAAFAREWLSLPNPALKQRIPVELAETDAGVREVEVILTRIAHGVYS
jgi:putative toxin-antitoxin system antitoxin component (TIGR02293 family)